MSTTSRGANHVDHPIAWERTVGNATFCPVCAGADTTVLLHQRAIPTNNSILCDDVLTALEWPVGSLRLTLCRSCGFVFNADFDHRLVEYSARIEETQAFSPHFVSYAETLANEWIERYDIRGHTIVEVGCGKAEFLSLMCQLGDNEGIGYDPAIHLDRVDRAAAGRLTFVAGLFGEDQFDLDADALVCRHTLEHIPQVHEFLSMLHRWAAWRSQPPIVLFEVPDVERVFDEVAFWDLFYEHCSYFTADTLRFAFERVGFEVIDIRHTYNGQYLVLEARPREAVGAARAIARAHGVPTATARALQFFERYRSITAACKSNVQQFAATHETLVLWGGGSKAVSFLTSLDIGHFVDFVVDVNPNKQGTFLVGTGHAVVAPEQLSGQTSLQVIVMNPAYMSEITKTLERLDVHAHITTVNDLLLPSAP